MMKIYKRNILLGVCFITIWIIVTVLLLYRNGKGVAKKNIVLKTHQVINYEDSINKMSLEQNKYFKMINICCPNIKEEDIIEDSSSISVILNNGHSISKIVDPSVIISKKDNKYYVKLIKKYKYNYIIKDNLKSGELTVLISNMQEPFIHKLVLDPGHGGYDIGGNVSNLKEKDITLAIAKEMKKYFVYNGFNTIMTRDTDEIPRHAKNAKEDTKARAEIANEASADIFISIHTNYYKESKYNGIATYYYTPKGFQDSQRVDLAKCIVKNVTMVDGWKNRGIFEDDLAVLRYTRMPSVLMECGFLSNSSDVEKLKNPQIIKNLCNNTVKGVLEYYYK